MDAFVSFVNQMNVLAEYQLTADRYKRNEMHGNAVDSLSLGNSIETFIERPWLRIDDNHWNDHLFAILIETDQFKAKRKHRRVFTDNIFCESSVNDAFGDEIPDGISCSVE